MHHRAVCPPRPISALPCASQKRATAGVRTGPVQALRSEQLYRHVGAERLHERREVLDRRTLVPLHLPHADGAQPDVGSAVLEEEARGGEEVVDAGERMATVRPAIRIVIERDDVDRGDPRHVGGILGRRARDALVDVAHAVPVPVGEDVDEGHAPRGIGARRPQR